MSPLMKINILIAKKSKITSYLKLIISTNYILETNQNRIHKKLKLFFYLFSNLIKFISRRQFEISLRKVQTKPISLMPWE